MIPIIILDNVPGANNTENRAPVDPTPRVRVVISFERYRDTGRWTHKPRARPFVVSVRTNTPWGLSSMPIGTYGSLAAAERAARKYAAKEKA